MDNTYLSAKIPEYQLQQTVGHASSPIKILKVENSSFQPKAIFLAPHRKNFYILVYVKQGTGRHWVDMVPYLFKSNTFYVTVPEQVHLKEEATLSGTAISFTKEYFALNHNSALEKLPIIKNSHQGHELVLQSEEIIYIEDLLEKLLTEYNKESHWQHEMLDAYMQTLLVYLSRIYEDQYGDFTSGANRELLRRFQQCIEVKYKQLHEVSAYARLMNASTSHLNNHVKEQSGRTAIAHIHDRLILESKRLLFNTSLSVKEIAFEIGFKDDSYFNRFFKGHENVTPTAYRIKIREMYR